MSNETKYQDYMKLAAQLRNDRASWVDHWRDCAENVRPRSFRYLATERNRGNKKNGNIINNKATLALRTMAAGMMAGITSPARPWFRLGTKHSDLGEFGSVRGWLDDAEDTLRKIFAASNIYKCLHTVYSDLGLFGTAPLHIDEDEKDVVRGYVFPVGQYMLANSSRFQVDTVVREYQMSANQLVQRFGYDACSQPVKSLFDDKRGQTPIAIIHIIEPNRDHDPARLYSKFKKFSSCWLEQTANPDHKFLLESGYDEFPVMCPRWNVTGEDVYGDSPTMEALGDIRALQLLERRKGQAFDKIVNPPMQGDPMLMNQRASLLPGEITYVTGQGKGFVPAVEINPNAMTVAEATIREHERRIDASYYADLWLMMSQSDGTDMTAREVSERHEEKMLQLGPVMEGLERELLGPLIDRVFYAALRAGLIPKPPDELHGQTLDVEYISIMAQAQKMLGISSMEKLAGFAGNLAATKPEVLDKLNLDEMVEEYAEMLGVPNEVIVPQDKVDQVRQARAQQAEKQQQMEQAATVAKGAQTLSQADMGGDNGLTRLIQNLPGVAGGQASAQGPGDA